VAASQSIRSLQVYPFDNSISAQDIAALTNLDRLVISRCAFGRGAFTALMVSLMPNGRLHGLHELNLYNFGIDSAKVAEIAQMLRSNTALKILGLRNPHIGDEGVIELADALSIKKTLTNLSVRCCGIGNAGAIALAGLLNKNATIQAVNLLANPAVTYKGRQALLKASLCNTSLEVLEMYGLGDADQRQMTRTLEINRFRKIYLEQDHSTISPYLYPRIFAHVSKKPSALFLFLQENREIFLPHLPDSSGRSMRKQKTP
jgi:hypothetical protein